MVWEPAGDRYGVEALDNAGQRRPDGEKPLRKLVLDHDGREHAEPHALAHQQAHHRDIVDLGGICSVTPARSITDLLDIALALEAALHAQFGRQIAEAWRQAIDAHAAPVEPSDDQIIDALLQGAYDRAAQRRCFAAWRPAVRAISDNFHDIRPRDFRS